MTTQQQQQQQQQQPGNLKLTLEQAIDRLGVGTFQHRILIAVGLCSGSDAIEVILLSFLALVVQYEFGVSATLGSLLTSIVFIGAMFGTAILGSMGDKYGRKPIFLASALIISISGLLTAAATTFWVMAIFRFGVGFGLGGIIIPYDTLAELVHSESRGHYLIYNGYFWALGACAVPVMGFLGLQEAGNWRVFILLCSIPCILSAILAMLWVPESPRWLISHGKHDKALEILRHGALLNGKDPLEAFPEGVVFLDDPEEEHGVHSFTCLFKKEWRRLTLTIWGTWAGMSMLYWGTMQIVTLVFSDSEEVALEGSKYSFDYGAIFSSSLAEVIGQTIILFLVNHGRVYPQSMLYLLGGIMVVGLCMAADSGTAKRSTLIAFAFLARMCMIGAGQLTWLITAELMPTAVRNTGHGAASAVARIGGACSPWLASPQNSFQTIAIAMGCIALSTSMLVCTLPETAGRALGTAATANVKYRANNKNDAVTVVSDIL